MMTIRSSRRTATITAFAIFMFAISNQCQRRSRSIALKKSLHPAKQAKSRTMEPKYRVGWERGDRNAQPNAAIAATTLMALRTMRCIPVTREVAI